MTPTEKLSPKKEAQGWKVCRARRGLGLCISSGRGSGPEGVQSPERLRLCISGADGAGPEGVQSPERSRTLHFRCTWCRAGRCVESGEGADFAFRVPTAGPEGAQSPERAQTMHSRCFLGLPQVWCWASSNIQFWPGAMAHACNPSTLRGQGRRMA